MKKDGYVHYPVLESEMAKRGILKRDVIELLGVENSTFSNKINGKRDFTLTEALAIWNKWFGDIPVDELFRHN
ncbi:MAG: XRE family transcriptional regulator [Ruminococcus flavefaciens]|nr:XRE family transcriptional regulator [Ruminococcus flavefaciens]